MQQETTVATVALGASAFKLLSIGRCWINDRQNATGTSPKLTIKIDQNLGINITLGANASLLLFENAKRPDKQDADYRVAVSLPTEIVDREIARQQALSVASHEGVNVEEIPH